MGGYGSRRAGQSFGPRLFGWPSLGRFRVRSADAQEAWAKFFAKDATIFAESMCN